MCTGRNYNAGHFFPWASRTQTFQLPISCTTDIINRSLTTTFPWPTYFMYDGGYLFQNLHIITLTNTLVIRWVGLLGGAPKKALNLAQVRASSSSAMPSSSTSAPSRTPRPSTAPGLTLQELPNRDVIFIPSSPTFCETCGEADELFCCSICSKMVCTTCRFRRWLICVECTFQHRLLITHPGATSIIHFRILERIAQWKYSLSHFRGTSTYNDVQLLDCTNCNAVDSCKQCEQCLRHFCRNCLQPFQRPTCYDCAATLDSTLPISPSPSLRNFIWLAAA